MYGQADFFRVVLDFSRDSRLPLDGMHPPPPPLNGLTTIFHQDHNPDHFVNIYINSICLSCDIPYQDREKVFQRLCRRLPVRLQNHIYIPRC